ncbi:MAG: hypothetical protein K2M95_00555 [Clostridiales bacterium]|nr:hypothetical protein [Clostridiales bacterium]
MRKIYSAKGILPALIFIFVSMIIFTFAIILCIYLKDIFRAIGIGLGWLACLFLLLYFYFTKAIIPVCVTDEQVKQGKVKYKWSDVKITAIPFKGRYTLEYRLLLHSEYIHDPKACKKEMRKCIRIVASQWALDMLLPYCKDKIFVLNFDGKEGLPCASSQRVNEMITSHNAKFDPPAEPTDCETNSSSAD